MLKGLKRRGKRAAAMPAVALIRKKRFQVQ
jgi:hypothetical protein